MPARSRGRPRSTTHRCSARSATRASSLASENSRVGRQSTSDVREPAVLPQSGTSASLDELRDLMLVISSQLSSHPGLAPSAAQPVPVSLAPLQSVPLLGLSSSLLGGQQHPSSVTTSVSTVSQPQTTAFLPPSTTVSSLGSVLQPSNSLFPTAGLRPLPGIGSSGKWYE